MSNKHLPTRDQYQDFDETPEDLAAWWKHCERRRLESMLPAGSRSPRSRELCSIDNDGGISDAWVHEEILSGIEPATEERLLEATRKRAEERGHVERISDD